MQEHAIPQDVTGYKFHIVGNMTLGQFAQLVVGALISFALFQTNLYAIVKWPLILLVVMVSIVAAFIPIAERPLSHWIQTFVKVLYRPTKFAWKRVPKIPDFFLFKPADDTGPQLPELDMTPLRRKRIQEFIATTRSAAGVDAEAVQVDQYVGHVVSLFESAPGVGSNTQQPTTANKPSLRVRTRSMRSLDTATEPLVQEALVADELLVSEEVLVEQPVATQLEPTPDVVMTNKATEVANWEASQRIASADDVAIPEETAPTIVPGETTEIQAATEQPALVAPALVTQSPTVANEAASAVTFNKELPFPSTPTTPNKLVGMILTKNNELIEGAVIEIRTDGGQVVRAVRSNALGQFYVTTPLASGKYQMVAEKDGRSFEPLSIELKGKIVDPIEIHSVE